MRCDWRRKWTAVVSFLPRIPSRRGTDSVARGTFTSVIPLMAPEISPPRQSGEVQVEWERKRRDSWMVWASEMQMEDTKVVRYSGSIPSQHAFVLTRSECIQMNARWRKTSVWALSDCVKWCIKFEFEYREEKEKNRNKIGVIRAQCPLPCRVLTPPHVLPHILPVSGSRTNF